MSATKPIAFFGLHVPAGDEPTPVISQVPMVGTIRITMAAIDPSAVPLEKDQPNRATLKILRRPLDFDDYLNNEDDDSEDEDSEEESDEEEEKPKANGKPSKQDKALKKAQAKAEKMEVDAKEDEEEDSDSDDEDGEFEIEEFVVCTLDPERNYQQTLEFTVDEDEEVFFKVVGNYDIYLTGNYVVPADEHDHDHDDEDSDYDSEEEGYDLSPTDSEIEMMEGDSESEDELDDLENPRITEVDSEEEKKESKKSLKRPAEEPAKAEEAPEKKLSKKQLKKLKANDGKAVDATQDTPEGKKKVQFAKELEQGPTGSAEKPKTKAEKKNEKKAAEKPTEKPATVRVVQGVKIEDKKEGTGAAAKNGSRLGMRYIGKLKNGKQFDANTKGKPFSFRLGKGEVIKGWDVGLVGMKVGGERRLEIPANMAYGSKSIPGIPGNSTLIFDVKLVEVK